jgi:hypothetical protein
LRPTSRWTGTPHCCLIDLEIPDQYRYNIWKAEFEHEESPGAIPSLTLIWLPGDHTGGAPDPVAQVADNDLAFGRIVETISRLLHPLAVTPQQEV